MRVLLDENLPHDLRRELPGHDVFTVQYMGWNGTKNGALLAVAAASGFDVMVTKDTGVPYQQNLATLPISVVVLEAPSNDMDDIRPLLPSLRLALLNLKPRSITYVR